MSFILLAIDGTSSATGYNTIYQTASGSRLNKSFVKQFHDNASISDKFFSEGPANQITGSDSGGILESAWSFLTRSLRNKPDAKVVLVGHSRGGHMATSLAIKLAKYKTGDFVVRMTEAGWTNPNSTQLVHFLGLYDAVDRTISHGGDTKVVPENVVNFAHAIRSQTLGSRTSFGNTATHVNSSNVHLNNYQAQQFEATHGAIGGSVPHGCSTEVGFLVNDYCNREISEADNMREAEKANQFVLAAARQAGVPV
jgi:hypothetical protein